MYIITKKSFGFTCFFTNTNRCCVPLGTTKDFLYTGVLFFCRCCDSVEISSFRNCTQVRISVVPRRSLHSNSCIPYCTRRSHPDTSRFFDLIKKSLSRSRRCQSTLHQRTSTLKVFSTMSGRGGRGCFGRGRYGPVPKYLSLKPPPSRFSCPNLTNNPFYLLGRSPYNEEIFISVPSVPSASSVSVVPSKNIPLPSSSFNGRKLLNVKYTESCVQNPQDSQTNKNSSRDAFIRFHRSRST